MERHGIMELCKILGYSFYFQLRINDEKSHSEIYGLHGALLTISIYIYIGKNKVVMGLENHYWV